MVTEPTTQDEIPVGDPDDRRAFEAREEQLFLEGRWEDLAGLYRRRLAASSVAADVSLQIPLLLRLAQVYEERILDPIAASETYWKLARLDPGHRPALRQLRGLHERAGQWDLVLQIAEIEGQAEMSPYERAAFEAELGRIWHEELSDPEEAMRAYERALAADPDHPAALRALADLQRRADRPEAAVALLERLTVRLRGPERAPTWIALGTLHAGPLGDPARAAVCFESALEDDPFQTVAAEWALLLATAAEDWPAVAQLLERRFDLASGARHRAAIAVEASQLQLFQLGSTAGARAWVDRAVELAPEDPAVLLARADVERADDDPRALLETLGRLCAQEQMPPSRALLWESARLHARFGQPRAALDALDRARARRGPAGGTDRVEESERLALQADCLRQLGEAAELAELLETWTAIESDAGGSDGSGDGGRVSRLHELARLYEEDLGDDDSAHGAWQRAFDLDPTRPEASDALERIHRKRDDPEALRALFETALESLGASPPAELSAKLGTLLLEGFGDLPAARVRLEAALEQSPGCRPALATLQRIAERIAEESGDPDLLLDLCAKEVESGVDETRMAEIVATVAPILEARGRLEEALEWATRWRRSAPGDRRPLALVADLAERLGRPDLELEARRALVRLQTGIQKSATLRRVAALHSQTGADEAAAQALREANASEPGELETVTALCDAYRRLERPRELVQALRQKLELLPLEAQSDTLEELAQRLQDPLGDLAAATVVRWRLIELPRPPEGAEQALETLLEEAGRYAELVQRLDERRERLGDDSEEALELDRRRARLRLDALGRSEEAARILAGLHARHPEDPELLDDLERALRVSDDARGLCALLEERAGREPDEARRLAMHFERASLLEESLGEPLGACDLLEACTRESTSATLAREACDRLEELLESLGQWRRLRDLLLRRCDGGLPEDEECALRERIARLSAERLQDLEGCAEQTEIVVRLAPTRLSAWQTLQTLYGGDLDRPGDFLRATEGELAQSPPESRELTLRVAAARLLLDDERRPADRERTEAHAHHARVLEIDPGHGEAAEALADHHEREGRPEEAARVLRMRLESDPDASGPETDALRLRLARIHSEELGQPERARPLLEAARLASGPCESIDEALAEVHLRTGDDEALAALCRERLDSTSDGPSSLPWRVRLAASDQRLGRLEDAARSYRAALIDSPDDREIEQALIAIYRALEEPEPLVELLEKRLPHASADESIALRLELATWHAEALGAPREALVQLERVLEIHPGHHEALDRALALSESLGDVPARLDLLERALALPRPGAQRARLLEQRGHLFAESTEQVERALPCFREALALDPSASSARDALRALLERLERWPAVLDCLFLEASEADATRRVALLEEGLEIAWERLGPDAALPWIERLRAERPTDASLLERMADAHRRAGRFEATLRAWDAELDLRLDPADRCRLHLERAQLLEREIGSPGRALLAYQRALELEPERDDILAALDRLYDSMQRPFERAAILERRVPGLDGPPGIAMRKTLAELCSGELADPERAIEPLLRNVDATRQDPVQQMESLHALGEALRASGRFEAWTRVAERELAMIDSHAEIAETTPASVLRRLREELARVHDEALGRPDLALHALRPLAAGDPESRASWQARSRDLLRRTGRAAELAESLSERLAAGGGRPEEALEEALELGRLREETLLDVPGARDAYLEAHRAAPGSLEALRGWRRCSERLRDWPDLATALELELALARELGLAEAQQAATARRLGDVCWRRLASGERAAEAYEQSLALEPGALEAVRTLADIAEAIGDEARALALHRRELSLLTERAGQAERSESESAAWSDPEDGAGRRRELWLRVAERLRDSDASRPEAIEAYRAAAALEPLPPVDALCLARLYEAEQDFEGYRLAFGDWCDRDDSGAGAADHLELAQRLLDREHVEEARDRVLRATRLSPTHPGAWLLLARLERDAGHPAEAVEAFERAAEGCDARTAASHRVAAAALLEPDDPERSLELLERAVADSPDSGEASLALVRIAARLGRDREAAREAERALSLDDPDSGPHTLEPAECCERALLGGRAALRIAEPGAVRRLFRAVLEIEPDHAEALEGLAGIELADGHFAAACPLLERRLEQPTETGDQAVLLAKIGRCLEAEGQLEPACARYDEALALEPALEAAHEGRVRVHERAGRTADALEALEAWLAVDPEPERRATIASRAAEAAWDSGDCARAADHLETATEADPRLAAAWLLRCEVVASLEVDTETRRVCTRALEAIEPGAHSARISLRLARLEEAAGRRETARGHFGEAARWDPRCVEAALCASRLARLEGDWSEADAVLARFIEAHPDPESSALGPVLLERGHLLSGPLERVPEAIGAYERALALRSPVPAARIALAGLLTHAPERIAEAIALHRSILEASPATASSWRALVELATREGQLPIADEALCVLHALGQASPRQASAAPERLRLPIGSDASLAEPEAEGLRRLAVSLRGELTRVLGDLEQAPSSGDPGTDAAARRILEAEAELAAPRLVRLPALQRAELFETLGRILLDPAQRSREEGPAAEIDRLLGRRARRRARRIVEETGLAALRTVDPASWGAELTALAAARVLDREDGGELGAVLRALLWLDRENASSLRLDGSPLGPLVETCEPARRLLARITSRLWDRLDDALDDRSPNDR